MVVIRELLQRTNIIQMCKALDKWEFSILVLTGERSTEGMVFQRNVTVFKK